jgi:molybdopterin-guanine dinucleotide biosynthesis protein A
MFEIPCVIFAGGKSSRMGEDKALLPFGGFDTLTQFQLDKLSKLFKNVYISCKNKNKFDPYNLDAQFVEDLDAQDIYAPTLGFISVFEKLQCERFFAISVDTPFIDAQIISKILEADSDHNDTTIARLHSKLQPMCGIYHKSLVDDFTKMLKENNHKLGFLLKSANTAYVDFQDEKPFLNLNNPSEYKEAQELIP